jgi:hypothetical protein
MLAVACGDQDEAPTSTGPLTETQVLQLFREWACPADPGRAQALYRPFAQALPQRGTWLLTTAEGQFRFNESTRTFETTPEATTIVEGLRANDACRVSQ